MKTHRYTLASMGENLFRALPGMLLLYDADGTLLETRHPDPALADPLTGRIESGLEERLLGFIAARPASVDPIQFLHINRSGEDAEFVYDVFLARTDDGLYLAGIRRIPDESLDRIESARLHRFFGEVLDNVAIPVSVKSMDTERYIYWSEKAELFGRTSGEMIGGAEELYMPPEQAVAVKELDRRLSDGVQRKYQGIERYVTVDGREHTFVVTRTPFVFGRERLILSSALDISELTETKASLLSTRHELAVRNRLLTSVLSLADVIPWGCDLEQRIFYCDYESFHPDNADGPDPQGRYVIPMNRYFAAIHPDFRREAVRMMEELAEGRREEVHETYRVHWFNRREWEWIRMQSSVSRRDAEGRPVELLGSAQRVTEQKRSELELRDAKERLDVQNAVLSSVLGIAQVMPWIGDLEEGFFYCDYALHHLEESAGPDDEGRYAIPLEAHFDRIHPDFRAHIYDQYVDLLEGRSAIFHETYPILWNNDRDYEWLEMQGSVYRRDAGGRPLQLLGSARVVTSQKRMEDSLREAKEQAEQSNMFKSAFLANMSHEIRTPLNAIVGFSELLAETSDEKERHEYIDIIRNSNAMLLQLISDILDLTKIESGTLEFTFADHDLGALFDELERTARLKVENPAVEVACADRATGCTIRTDRGRLLQVLHNFIGNAAKFTRRGHIRFGCRRQPDRRWYFYVEDTGCGIAAGKIDSVFDRFVKLDNEAKGTGLGLAISKSIVERLGGEIGVFSAEGQGSTFWFVLPSASVTAAGPKQEGADILPVQHAPQTGPATILIAEDDPANYRLFEAMLRKHYTLYHAWDGRQAVDMFREHRPDMILMDIKMPRMDGYEATAAIRALSSDIPIVAVTAFAYPDDMRRILSNGFDGCLPKPVSADKLKKKITDLCGRKSAF